MRARVFLFFFLIPVFTAPVRALEDPCRDDLIGYCGHAGDSMAECIRKNKDKFSKECQASVSRVTAMMEARAQTKNACQADARRFCAKLKFDLSDTTTSRLRDCLRSHYNGLSARCQAEIDQW